MVEHWGVESLGLRFDSSWGLRIFSLSNASLVCVLNFFFTNVSSTRVVLYKSKEDIYPTDCQSLSLVSQTGKFVSVVCEDVTPLLTKIIHLAFFCPLNKLALNQGNSGN